jgi:hypothetical protein
VAPLPEPLDERVAFGRAVVAHGSAFVRQ